MFYFISKPTGKICYVEESVQNLDLFTLFNSPTRARVFTLVVNSGVVINASTTANAAVFASSAFPTGSVLKIINNGCIHGMGGAAGGVGVYAASPFTGSNGGAAITLPCKTYITNSVGYVFGGGGGGAAYVLLNYPNSFSTSIRISGSGGAGGGTSGGGTAGSQGYRPSGFYSTATPSIINSIFASVGAIRVFFGSGGTTGLTGTYGATGYIENSNPYLTSGRGGSYGENGQSAGYLYVYSQGPYLPLVWDLQTIYAGGSAGAAIQPNGYELTFLSGLTVDRVKGAYN